MESVIQDSFVTRAQKKWGLSPGRAAKVALLARVFHVLQNESQPTARTINFRKPATVLLLGMVFATETRPIRGQEYRDRVRCEALEDRGFNVRTLDDKHQTYKAKQGKHCCANFCDARKLFRAMNGSQWEGTIFDHLILDYFFSPGSWARERWTDPLFTSTLPALAVSGYLAPGCKIWLPGLECIRIALVEFRHCLEPFFEISSVQDPTLNPLFLATEDAEQQLMMCPDKLINSNQIVHLMSTRPGCDPFYVLQLRDL